jgi:hypothetical protein
MTETMLCGGCLCGAVRYEVPDAFVYAGYCHCSKCRKATGAANKPFAGIERNKLRPLAQDGDMLVVGDPAETHDIRCRHCGSLLWSVVREHLWVHVSLGTLDNAPSIEPREHLFVASKAPWEVLPDDGVPRYVGHSNGPRMP